MLAAGGLLVGGIAAHHVLMTKRPKYPKQIGPYAVPDGPEEGSPYHNVDYPELVTIPYPGCDTLHSVFNYALKTHGSRNALGTRELIKARAF